MNLPDRDEIRQLCSARPAPGVSLSLPTHRILRGAREDAVVLENLLNRAEEELRRRGYDDARAWLAPARALTRDEGFWLHQLGGLQIYLSPQAMRVYALPYRVPEQLWIGERFAVRPLAPMWSDDARFHVLAVSLQSARLLSASRWFVAELADGLPQGLEAIDTAHDHQEGLQLHDRGPLHGFKGSPLDRGHSGHRHETGGRDTMFFGQGYGHDDHKDDVARYLQLLDAKVCARVGSSGLPLAVAAVDFVGSIYRDVSHHPDIAGVAPGSIDTASPRELQERAWPLIEARIRREQRALAERIQSAAANGHALTGLGAIVQAAYDGRVHALMIDPSEPVWGRFDPAARRVELHAEPRPGDEDLADLAAALTVRNGGDLVAHRVNERDRIGALLRY